MAAWPTPLSSGRFCSWLAAFRRNSPATSWKRDDRFADAADAGCSDPHLRNDPTISNENLARELSGNVLVRCRELRGSSFFDRLVRLGEPEQDEQFDDRPGWIELAGPEAELRAAWEPVMIVVEPFPAGDEREQPKIGGRIV